MKSNPIITDEMLAAYLAGNATACETALILRAIETDPTIRETLRIMSELENEETVDVLPMMAMAAKNEVDNLCAIRCIGYALRHFGIEVTDEQIHTEALQSGSLTAQGMPFGMLGEFISPYGLGAQYIPQCTIENLSQILLSGAVVIALVDGGELTGDYELEKREDVTMGLGPDHVVVVERIENDKIFIRDSYTPNVLDRYSLFQFDDAWGDSGKYVVMIKNIELK